MSRKSRLLGSLFFLSSFLFLALTNHSFADQSQVTRVIDGDTVVLDNGEHVRLIGVDTTEKSHPLKPLQFFSEEASKFTKNLVEGKQVRLEYDKERRGKYGRLLAYVYLMDGTFVNAEIIRQGYGFAYTKYPFKYKKQFVSLEKEARENKRGYWRYGGRGELEWLIGQGRKPFLVYQMAQNLWGIKYDGFIKTRLNNNELISALTDLRVWACEFDKEDLEKQLIHSDWEKESK